MAVEEKNEIEILGVTIKPLTDSQVIALLPVFVETKGLLTRFKKGRDDSVWVALQLVPFFPELISKCTAIPIEEIKKWEAAKVFVIVFGILKLNESRICRTIDKLGDLRNRGIFTNGNIGFT
jgi:hypothetical protein